MTIILICLIIGAIAASKKEDGSIIAETLKALIAFISAIGCLGILAVAIILGLAIAFV